MYPIYDYNGICEHEAHRENKHIIMFLIVKPGYNGSETFTRNFNYWHQRSNKFCNIYLIGYSKSFPLPYADTIEVDGINGEKLQYSDSCFCSVIDQMESRLTNFKYSGEPELFILQNKENTYGSNTLDFSNYSRIEINYGLEKKYIDSFPRFMERLIRASRSEVEAIQAVRKASLSRLKPKKVILNALEYDTKLPLPIKKVMSDRLFYKTYRG